MKHAENARSFMEDSEEVTRHDAALWHIREKRDARAQEVPEWEALRECASQIKENVLAHLDEYLIQFEFNAKKNGIQVHWASTAAEHNDIVLDILSKANATRMVKSKSMLTEECGLNHHLEANGIEVIDTDLGERIVQLAEEPPSHIVMPAVHRKREEIGQIFHDKMGTPEGETDATVLTRFAREDLRKKFLGAQVALTGVNFGVAETGGVVVCTNEGNADMGVHLAPIQIHCMGIEKIIPRVQDLGVFTRLLARSGAGQPITIYTSHHQSPKVGGEMHIVIVDNGRSSQLGRPDFRKSLACIRCGACLNTCPIYRRSGGYSYDYAIPGPIGSILTPGIDLEKYSSLPFASTLCGSCTDVCPVKIDIHQQLYKWRQIVVQNGFESPKGKRMAMNAAEKVFAKESRYRRIGKLARKAIRFLPDRLLYSKGNSWGRQRDLPDSPKESFKEWYVESRSE